MNHKRNSVPAEDSHRTRARALTEERGEVEAAKTLGISRTSLLRIIAGRPVSRIMRSFLEQHFGPGETAS